VLLGVDKSLDRQDKKEEQATYLDSTIPVILHSRRRVKRRYVIPSIKLFLSAASTYTSDLESPRIEIRLVICSTRDIRYICRTEATRSLSFSFRLSIRGLVKVILILIPSTPLLTPLLYTTLQSHICTSYSECRGNLHSGCAFIAT